MITPSARAEAAVWLARLRSEERTVAEEEAFRVWLAADTAHAAAFEDLSAAWDSAGAYTPPAEPAPLHKPLTRRVAIGTGAGLVAAAASYIAYVGMAGSTRYVTQTGERRQLTLEDRSQVTLDSDSSLEVAFSGSVRRLTLERGRAYFDVAHDRARPFVATAGGHEVIALGTAFEIDHASSALSVILVEGKVAVRSGLDEAFMRAGDRLVYEGSAAPRRDRPDVARLVAWQRGQLIFDNDRLSDAMAQMGRYSSRPMVIADPALGNRRVSGAFSISEPAAFARSVGVLLDAPVAVTSAQIVIGSGEKESIPMR
ncbi:FecR family protein [Sphingobium sp. EM0848]|uniref:FecR family protein n=1 Tax=Sphingobium sp. EM0848 TaxID=2743473 RepID=UPI00159C93A4|nr:FecR domain-containing protein [Sphingobium sp. EM0848]